MKDRFDTFLSRYLSAKAWLVLHATLQSFGGRLGGATEPAGSGLAAVNGRNGQPFRAPLGAVRHYFLVQMRDFGRELVRKLTITVCA